VNKDYQNNWRLDQSSIDSAIRRWRCRPCLYVNWKQQADISSMN